MNDQNNLVGIITLDDVIDVIREEDTGPFITNFNGVVGIHRDIGYRIPAPKP